MKRFIEIVALLIINSATIALVVGAGNAADRLDTAASDPLNATYLIEGKVVGLVDGRCEVPAAPGSAMKTRTAVWGQPVYGDMDGDGDEDTAVLLTHDPGGSGTFYYVAAAVSVDGRYQGTNAVLLGDRIAPTDIEIRNGGIVVNYAGRRPEEPMSATPSVDKTTVLFLEKNQLNEGTTIGEKGTLFEGWVTIGHEVRSFEPCIRKRVLWLMGQSPALKEIMAAYRRVLPDEKTYHPVFMVLYGKLVKPPVDGFGAEYEAAFLATYLVRVAPGENCTRENFGIDSSTRTKQKITFDISGFDASGLYGPLGGKRALSYEFCIPNTVMNRTEVERIDPTVTFFDQSPGRIGCGTHESLCIGSTHQKDFAKILRRLAELTYVQRIDQSFFE
ncbi:MAG: hypothetical protein ABF291_16615 [Desulfobacterales bacterium]